MPTLKSVLRGVRLVMIQGVIITVITVALLEGIVAFSFRYPGMSLLPSSLLRYLHERFDRHTIQVMPECAQYDPGVTYTLRPGRCVFANREFSNEFRINSLGVRDDEASLEHPAVVMLGDSLTMGWGVEQDQAFPSLIERSTGMRTLNAGISSYGTVRELRLLERIDRSALKHLVIQYTANDFAENEQYVANSALTILSKADYERTVEVHRQTLKYVPGKYAFNVLVQIRSMLGQRMSAASQGPGRTSSEREADVFLQVLERSPVDLSSPTLTVLSLESQFIAAARARAAASANPLVRRLKFVDVSGIAQIQGAFYRLDDHPTATGHEAIARELARSLGDHAGSPN